jgi:hypothetical protein
MSAGVLIPDSLAAVVLHLVRESRVPIPAEVQPLLGELSAAAVDASSKRARDSAAAGEVERLRLELAEACSALSRAQMDAHSKRSSVRMVAEQLRVTPQRVRQLLDSGQLSGQKDDRGTWHIDTDSVTTYKRGIDANSGGTARAA